MIQKLQLVGLILREKIITYVPPASIARLEEIFPTEIGACRNRLKVKNWICHRIIDLCIWGSVIV